MTESIRDATLDDLDIIVRFNRQLAKESEGKDIPASLLEPGVSALLADNNKGCYFLLERDGRIVGQTMITYEWSDWRNGWFWWIQSVYVEESARGTGAFSALYNHIHELAKSRDDICGIRLYVDHDNTHAAAVYRKLGMNDAHYHMLEIDFRLA